MVGSYIRTPRVPRRPAMAMGAYHARPRRRLRGVGDDSADIWTGASVNDSAYGPDFVGPIPTPTQAEAASILSNISFNATLDTNPTDYTTPSAAIAAGLDPATVNAAWAQGLSRYSTQAQAVAAGIAPGVVQQYWAASRAYPAPASTAGLSSSTLLLIGGGIFALALLSGGGKRR